MPRKAVKRTAWKRTIARTTRTVSVNDEPPKGQRHTAEIIVEVIDKNGAMVPTRALLDMGTSTTIIVGPFIREGTAHTNKSRAQQWETLGGRFATASTANVRFRFPELDNTKTITWIAVPRGQQNKAHGSVV
jgi:hypothetical protein